ncbi:MAG: TetR/AcrR family transcriptional regulator [Gammaproteobacteria bacterium]|nr:TetR/AcrR family transcriptional regulator [Gammaproteobacteria bacterium]NNJ72842.1 TetR/AcrR family transcriptional regulator [Enterobacterales bacterium]
MKTAERILLISLDLFNHHGEPNVSSVDIANELEISPGNLYYHFKGKELIISALFDLYQREMSKILTAPNKDKLNVEDFFYYLLLILQVSHKFLFLYRNPAEISEKYPQVSRSFQRVLASKQKTYATCIQSFAKQGLFVGDSNHQQQMVELLGLITTQSPNYHQLLGRDINDGDYMYQSLATILFSLAPYFNIEQEVFHSLTQLIDNQYAAPSDRQT